MTLSSHPAPHVRPLPWHSDPCAKWVALAALALRHPHRLAGRVLRARNWKPRKSKWNVVEVASPKVKDPCNSVSRLLRMQHELALRQPDGQRCRKARASASLLQSQIASSAYRSERNIRDCPRGSTCTRGAENRWPAAARSPTLPRPRRARDDAAVLLLPRRLQSALDVEQPAGSRYGCQIAVSISSPSRLVEEGLDVEVENPVRKRQAAHAGLGHRIDGRPAGSVAR